MTDINERCVFALGPTEDGGGPVLIVGFPDGALKKLRKGEHHNFDLTSVGIPLRVMFFSEKTHHQCVELLKKAAAANGKPFHDMRGHDFKIKPTNEGEFDA